MLLCLLTAYIWQGFQTVLSIYSLVLLLLLLKMWTMDVSTELIIKRCWPVIILRGFSSLFDKCRLHVELNKKKYWSEISFFSPDYTPKKSPGGRQEHTVNGSNAHGRLCRCFFFYYLSPRCRDYNVNVYYYYCHKFSHVKYWACAVFDAAERSFLQPLRWHVEKPNCHSDMIIFSTAPYGSGLILCRGCQHMATSWD